MTPFGFTPDSSDDAEENNGDGSVDFAAMMQKMQQEYQVYLVQREKRLQAYEKKIRASTPPETSVPALDAPAP